MSCTVGLSSKFSAKDRSASLPHLCVIVIVCLFTFNFPIYGERETKAEVRERKFFHSRNNSVFGRKSPYFVLVYRGIRILDHGNPSSCIWKRPVTGNMG